MLLRDLLAESDLGLVLLSGREYLENRLLGVYITDLLDPRRYLEGGEVVLSGLVWHGGPDDSERFVAALAESGVSALAAGTARLGHTPPDLVEACRGYGIPVFEVPVQVSFSTLAERIQREHRYSGPRPELVGAVSAGAGLHRVLQLAAAEFDAACWVLSAAGRTVGGTEELPAVERGELVRHFFGADRFPATFRFGTGPYVVWPVEAEPELRASRWFIALRGDQQDWNQRDQQQGRASELATELANAVALLRVRCDEAERVTGRSIESALRRWADGTASPSEVTARLETTGLATGGLLRVIALTVRDSDLDPIPLLREIAAATGMTSATMPFSEGACALLIGTEAELSELDGWLNRITAEAEPGLDGRRLAIGVSDISAATDLHRAWEEAGHARRLAATWPGPIGIASGKDLASHQVLLASVPDALRRSYRDRLLSKLGEYDRAHRSDLVHTLRVFLEYSGSWSRCAERLHVHVNTLRYRIKRVEEITGRDLTGFTARVDFQLALELDQDNTGP